MKEKKYHAITHPGHLETHLTVLNKMLLLGDYSMFLDVASTINEDEQIGSAFK